MHEGEEGHLRSKKYFSGRLAPIASPIDPPLTYVQCIVFVHVPCFLISEPHVSSDPSATSQVITQGR